MKPNSLFLLLALFFFSSCEKAVEPVTDKSQVWPSTAQSGGGFKVTIHPDRDLIVEHEHFSLDVKVVPPNTDGYGVSVDADMPTHQHGMNTSPELVELGPNHYRVDGMLFHMMGDWMITVTVGPKGMVEKLNFPVFVE